MAVYLDTSAFLRPESLRAAKRHSLPAIKRVRDLLEAVTLVQVTTDICERAADLDPAIFHSLDAIHLATALALGDSLEGVVTYDDRLAHACALHGVDVQTPGQQ